MNKSFVVHGFAVFVQPRGWLVEVDEGVQQTAFVKFAIGHGAQRVQIAGAAAVDFAAHAKRFTQVNGFHQWGEAAHIPHAAAGYVTGSGWGDELSLKQREVIDPVFVPVF